MVATFNGKSTDTIDIARVLVVFFLKLVIMIMIIISENMHYIMIIGAL